MSSTHNAQPEAGSVEVPAVPLTLEGYSVLHQMMRVRWASWRHVDDAKRTRLLQHDVPVLARIEQNADGQSAMFSMLGHKADLMFVHFRQSFDELNQAELQLAQLEISEYLEITTSYVSVIELGLYESTMKTYAGLVERGIEPHSEEWKQEIAGTYVFIPWTGGGAKTRTGIWCRWKSALGR
jgi:chlorite dismutase